MCKTILTAFAALDPAYPRFLQQQLLRLRPLLLFFNFRRSLIVALRGRFGSA
jgi:hypothetical protein